MNKQIYCDNAALRPLLPEVKELIQNWLDYGFCNPSAIYPAGRETKKAIEVARETVANAIGASPDEIVFTSGATEGLNWVCGDETIYTFTTPIEHKAILNNGRLFVRVDESGTVDLDNLNKVIPFAYSFMIGWVNNEIGTIQPIKEIVELCHKKQCRVCIDATQGLGHLPINVHELGCDYLVGSFGKLGGLPGSGFIYMRKGRELGSMLKGGAQERGFRAGTENFIGIIAGAKALEIATTGIDIKMSRMTAIRDKIISGLLEIPKSQLNGGMGNRVCNNINVSFEGIESESLVLLLDLKGIMCSGGSACNSADLEPSHVLKAIGLSDDLARGALRITINETMTDDEADYVIETVTECVAKLRSMSPKWKEIEQSGSN